ncbi:RNA polymerase sigma factor SigZ [Mariprofundus ferrooxydans]|uniref:RNA polymerase sigma factor SigZ n=1 Tax=Mariprofundus ferrooxydans TaxID=314344 RepID=UPI00142F5D98|nr:RNA polymerase sigma factor SigZ [Mariprofundus ferrooxydans]
MVATAIELWQAHKDRLYNYIVRRVPDRHVADDILQEVFLKAHISLTGVNTPGSVSAWLFRVAANAIADYYRARKPAEQLPDDLPALEQERDYIAELADCLQPLIDDLPEIYRNALVLSEIEGMTQQELATRLGLSLSGAKSRVQRGREQLRLRLLQCCEIEVGKNGLVGYETREHGCHCNGNS